MIFGVANLISLVAATSYELIAIHSDDIFAYSVVKGLGSNLALEGEPIQFEFSNGGLKTLNPNGDGIITVKDGYLSNEIGSSECPNYGWSLHDSIYLPGEFWICDDEARTIATGDHDPPRSCQNPIGVLLYASPI